MKTIQLQSDFHYCESIIKRHSKSFYYAFSQLPVDKAHAVYAIYAFCRMADDAVDENEGSKSKQQALQELKEQLDLFSRNEEPDQPLWRALRYVFDQFNMSVRPFYDQLRGQAMDVNFSPPKTLAELERYSYYVAGSVGLMLLPVIASEQMEELKESAVQLGVAMQITNILRDIGEDLFTKGRVYIPQSQLERYSYTVEDLSARKIDGSFIALWESLAKRAENLYDEFLEVVDRFDSDSQLPVSMSAQLYRGILDAVRENHYDCLTTRNYVDERKFEHIKFAVSS